MTVAAFTASLVDAVPPASLTPALVALWHDGRSEWDLAHQVAQDIRDQTGSHIHAYLHRKEGDESNAHYWYRKAGVVPASDGLDEEWHRIVTTLLERLD